jgi:hypothetical protein
MDLIHRQNSSGVSVVCRVAIAALVVAVFVGCSDTTGPEKVAAITTPSSTIALQATPQGPVLNTLVTVTNTSAYAMGWSSCGVTLEKAGLPALPPGKSEWQSVWARACYLLQSGAALSGVATPIPDYPSAILKPGETVTIQIVAPTGQQPYPTFDGQPGQYRFHVPLSISVFGTFHSVPHDLSVSEPFTLQPAQ